MKFYEQIVEKNSNYIKSYTASSINIFDEIYKFNVIVPPRMEIIKCVKNSNNISTEFIISNLLYNVDFIIISLNDISLINKKSIILKLNKLNIGIDFMSISAGCSCHNILLSENRNYLTYFLFK